MGAGRVATISTVAVVVLVVAAMVAGAAADTPQAPVWGGALAFEVEVLMSDVSDSPKSPLWSFDYFYLVNGTNATHYSAVYSRYNHHLGNGDEVCAGIEGAPPLGTPCSVIHSSDQNWLYIEFTSGGTGERLFCCKCTQGVGAVRPDWLLLDSSYEGVYKGADSYGMPFLPPPVGAPAADRFLKYGQSDNNYYATPEPAQLPVRFNEHKNGLLKQWDFVLPSYRPRDEWREMAAPPALFDPPAQCEERCKNSWCSLY